MASDFESTTNALHVGGRMPAGAIQIPLIFYSFTDSGSLKVDLNAVDTNIRSVSTFLGLAGAAGKPIVAYSEIVGGGSSPYTSQILVGSPDSLPTAVPILTRDASYAVVLYPLAVAANGDQAAGVWYTRTPNGIGDATFPVYQGLSYYDIAGQKSSEVLTEDQNPAGMSPDLTWAAFTVAPGHGSDQGAALNLIDLASKQTTTLPIDPSSVLGSGYAVFSPDNQYVAWMEASGSAPEAVKTEIRIARVDGSGTPVTVDAAALASVTGGWPVLWEKPAGWLDNDTLLVQLEGDGVVSVNSL
jgi:hypothetical protein